MALTYRIWEIQTVKLKEPIPKEITKINIFSEGL